MNRIPLKKIGIIGRANIEARQRIAEIAEEKQLNYCEIKLLNCQNWPLAPAHLHKRAWYKGNIELLANYNQWVAACQHCHNQIEHNKELTEEIFKILRPY